MSYTANLETAITYHTTGLDDRALEMLDTAMNAVPEDERNGDNPAYLKIFSMLAKIKLSSSQGEVAWEYVRQGLAHKEDHVDLLFLRMLMLMDRQQYDEMFSTLIKYLLALVMPQINQQDTDYMYEYAGEGALTNLYNNLIPTAYGNSVSYEQTREVVRQLAEKLDHPVLTRAYEVMQKVDKKRTEARNEQKEVTQH